MFPPVAAVGVLVAYVSFEFAIQAVTFGGALRITWRTVLTGLSFVLLSLLMRVYDEMKDYESDLKLAREGDPRYVNRPLMTGVVRIDDVVALRWFITAVLFALNIPLGFPLPFGVFVGVFFFEWLTFKWFFCRNVISTNLLLAFATHQPLCPLMFAYVLSVFVVQFEGVALDARHAALVVAFWFPLAAWEVGRKVRAREEETSYDTYTKRLGTLFAPLIPAALVSATTGLVLAVAWSSLWTLWIVFILVANLYVISRCVKFVISPRPAFSNLRPSIEIYMIAMNGSVALNLGIRGL